MKGRKDKGREACRICRLDGGGDGREDREGDEEDVCDGEVERDVGFEDSKDTWDVMRNVMLFLYARTAIVALDMFQRSDDRFVLWKPDEPCRAVYSRAHEEC